MNADEVYRNIRNDRIIVIVRGVDISQILSIADAVYSAGIRLIEITCNTQGFEEMIAELSSKMSDKMTIGAGTVITKDLCEKCVKAGAKYIIAPDMNPEIIEYCVQNDIAVIPGAATPTEVLTAARLGAKMIKIFPASSLGADFILQLRGPVNDVDFIAVGGVKLNNIKEFIEAGCIGIGIGGSVIKKDLLQRSDWQSITSIAKGYVKKMDEVLAEQKRKKND